MNDENENKNKNDAIIEENSSEKTQELEKEKETVLDKEATTQTVELKEIGDRRTQKNPSNYNISIITIAALILSFLSIALTFGNTEVIKSKIDILQSSIVDMRLDQMQNQTTSNLITPQTINPSNTAGSTTTTNNIYENNVDAIVEVKSNILGTSFLETVQGVSTGTGFIVESNGYIVTNYHVIASSTNVTVTLHSGQQYTASIVGYDEDNDIAILKIDANNLQCVKIGSSKDLKIGDTIVTIGNPLYLNYSMTQGIVSCIDRIVTSNTGAPLKVIQTDCSLNEGNSGGPVFNSAGEVIGVANAKYSGDTIEGIGFAIPIDKAINDFNQIKKYGEIQDKAILGIVAISVNNSTAQAFHLTTGAYVNSINSGSCAEKAGIKVGDIIVKANGTPIAQTYDLLVVLMDFSAGDNITLDIWRNGQIIQVNAVLDSKSATDKESETILPNNEIPDDNTTSDNNGTGSTSMPNILPFTDNEKPSANTLPYNGNENVTPERLPYNSGDSVVVETLPSKVRKAHSFRCGMDSTK